MGHRYSTSWNLLAPSRRRGPNVGWHLITSHVKAHHGTARRQLNQGCREFLPLITTQNTRYTVTIHDGLLTALKHEGCSPRLIHELDTAAWVFSEDTANESSLDRSNAIGRKNIARRVMAQSSMFTVAVAVAGGC